MDLLEELLSDSASTPATGLNDQITKIDAQHIAGGSFADAWVASYGNGRKTVKIIRCVLVNRCVLQSALRNLQMWSKVKQKHVSSLIGVLTFIGSTIVGIVSVSTANQRGFHRLSSNILDIATNAILVLVSNRTHCFYELDAIHDDTKRVGDSNLVHSNSSNSSHALPRVFCLSNLAFGLTGLRVFSIRINSLRVVCATIMQGTAQPALPRQASGATWSRLTDTWWYPCSSFWHIELRPSIQCIAASFNSLRLYQETEPKDALKQLDPSPVHDYDEEYEYVLQDMERRTMPSTEAIDQQPEVQWYMRLMLIEFLVEVHSSFRLRAETLYLTVNVIDRYLSRCIVCLKHLQLVGCVAFWIAAKYEEMEVPDVEDLVEACHDSYSESLFIQMEAHILSTIEWTLGHPTAESRLRFMCLQPSIEEPQVQHVARFIMELTLFYREFIQYTPTSIASAALTFARVLCGTGQLPCGDADGSLEIISHLHTRLLKHHNIPEALMEKYSDTVYSEAATFVVQSYLRGFVWKLSTPFPITCSFSTTTNPPVLSIPVRGSDSFSLLPVNRYTPSDADKGIPTLQKPFKELQCRPNGR